MHVCIYVPTHSSTVCAHTDFWFIEINQFVCLHTIFRAKRETLVETWILLLDTVRFYVHNDEIILSLSSIYIFLFFLQGSIYVFLYYRYPLLVK
jgi:hypothetical protein